MLRYRRVVVIVPFENLADQHNALFVLALVFHVFLLAFAFVAVEAAAKVNQLAVVARNVNAIAATPVLLVRRVEQRRCDEELADGEEANILRLPAR